MKLYKLLAGLLAVASLLGAGSAQAALTFWSRGELMLIHGKAEQGDVDKLKLALTPAIKTIVVRSPTGLEFDIAAELARVVEKADVTTVLHGECAQLVCPMLFLSGKQRMFSGVGPAEAHTLSLLMGETTHVIKGTSSNLGDIAGWWARHTTLGRAEIGKQSEGFIQVVPSHGKMDRKVFFPAQANFSKGKVLHCSGDESSRHLADCKPVLGASAIARGIVTTDEPFVDARLTEAPDIAAPAATDHAALDADLNARVSDKCVELYREFLKQDSPRAFVVSSRQGCWSTTLGFRPRERALKACQKGQLSGKECRFYAVDDKVVFTPFEQDAPAAR